jgi:hypothetical protein
VKPAKTTRKSPQRAAAWHWREGILVVRQGPRHKKNNKRLKKIIIKNNKK